MFLQGVLPEKASQLISEVYKAHASFFMSSFYTPCYMIGGAFAKMISGTAGTKIAEKDVIDRLVCVASTDIITLFNTYGPIIPVPKFFENKYPNFFKLMTLDLFSPDCHDEPFYHVSTDDKYLTDGKHLATNIPNFVFFLTWMTGIYYKYITDDDEG